jgi:hypothetical protein
MSDDSRAPPTVRSPLSVLMSTMNYWAARADTIAAQLAALDDNDPDGARPAAELLEKFIDAQQRATAAATACAPFIHARASSTPTPPLPPDPSADIAIINDRKASPIDVGKAYLTLVSAPAPPPPMHGGAIVHDETASPEAVYLKLMGSPLRVLASASPGLLSAPTAAPAAAAPECDPELP